MPQKIISLLAIDCGSISTKVALIEQINEIYQLTAQAKAISTHKAPWNDVTLGVIEALKEIEQLTQRQFLTQQNTPLIRKDAQGNNGVDALVVVSSAAPALQILAAGLTNRVSLATAQRAIASSYANINTTIALDDDLSKRTLDYRVDAIQQAKAQVLLLVGGTDDGATKPVLDLAHSIALAIKNIPSKGRPRIIYAGNTHLRSELAQILGSLSDFKPIANILPDLQKEDLTGLQSEIDIIYTQHQLAKLPEFNTLSKWSNSRIIPSVRSFNQTISYIGQSYAISVLGVEVGNSHTTIATKNRTGRGSTTCINIGTGNGVPNLLHQTKIEDFQRWLPFAITLDELKNFLHNKWLFPQTVPQTYQELLKELAIIRELLRLSGRQAKDIWSNKEDWYNWRLIVASGEALTNLPHHAMAVLALLDGLEPVGISKLALDTHNLMPRLGGVASIQPLAAAQVTGYDALLILGTLIAPFGQDQFGKTALRLKITYEDKQQEKYEIPAGTIEVIPLEAHQYVTLEVNPTSHFSVGDPHQAMGNKVVTLAEGGSLGLIIDTRGRPIVWAKEEEERRQQIQEWLVKLSLPPGAVDIVTQRTDNNDT